MTDWERHWLACAGRELFFARLRGLGYNQERAYQLARDRALEWLELRQDIPAVQWFGLEAAETLYRKLRGSRYVRFPRSWLDYAARSPRRLRPLKSEGLH